MTEALSIGEPIIFYPVRGRVGHSGRGAVQRALHCDGHCWLHTHLVLENCSLVMGSGKWSVLNRNTRTRACELHTGTAPKSVPQIQKLSGVIQSVYVCFTFRGDRTGKAAFHLAQCEISLFGN